MKFIYTTFLLLAMLPLHAQVIANFEGFNLAPGEFLNNAAPSDAFEDGHILLPNTYDVTFDFWTGWAISAVTDNQMPGFLNQYSAIPGSGVNGSTAYAVSYNFPLAVILLNDGSSVENFDGMYLTNSTYAYFSMKDGDAFAKKFGGITGDDPDFFLLTIKGYQDGQLGSDSINFYLADFRSANNSEDYLVDEWTWLDLSPLAEADSLQCSLSSSDNGAFGMNTPAYFCVDDILSMELLADNEVDNSLNINVFPNPTTDFLTFAWQGETVANACIFNANGVPVFQKNIGVAQHRLNVSGLPKGIYWLRLESGEGFSGVHSFVKR